MKHKTRLTLAVLMTGLLAFCILLTVWLMALMPIRLIWLPAAVLAVLFLLLALFAREVRAFTGKWISGTKFGEKAKVRYSLESLPTPAALLSGKTVLWYNSSFLRDILQGEASPIEAASNLLPGLDLGVCAAPGGQLLRRDGRVWHIYASTVAGESEPVSILCFSEETSLRATAAEYAASRPGCILFAIDGYDDVFGDLLDSERAGLLESINRLLETTVGRTTGLLRRVGTGRYLAVMEERHLKKLAEERYTILDAVRELAPNRNLSLSVGVGRGAKTLAEAQEMAEQALDMAQGRSGDQAAEKTPDGFTFYGGVSHGVEKRSRVKSRIVATALVDLIKQAESVVIMGHRLTDLDALGAAEGVLRICKICNVPAVIAVRRSATLAKSLLDAFDAAGCADDFIEPEDVLEDCGKKTLCIVVDTYLVHLLESREIYEKCGSTAVIDHHRKAAGYIPDAVLVCHEPYASSASELVAEILQYVGGKDDKATRLEAEGLLAGIMLDTHGFSLHTGVRTFEAAAALRRCGAETENVRALFNTSMAEYEMKCELVEGAQVYRGCAVSLHEALPDGMNVAVPQAANDLLTIDGVEAGFVAVRSGAGVTVSARSMGRVNVQVIMEALGGGGHQTMAGAQLRDVDLEQARAKLCAAIDLYRAAQDQEKKKTG